MSALVMPLNGILNPRQAATKFTLTRQAPAPDLADLIERYWIIDWDLRGEPPFVQETVPYPCVNVALEQGASGVFGIEYGKAVRTLEGRGHVFGIKFRPGGFYPFLKAPVAPLRGRVLPLSEVFGPEADAWEQDVLSCICLDDQVARVDAFLQAQRPVITEPVRMAQAVIAHILNNPGINQVNDLVRDLALSKRTLQRLFNQIVGVSPKWVILRCRLLEATAQLEQGTSPDWTRLAFDLGYFDQSHFIRDFKSLIGATPSEYARCAAG